MSPATEWEQLGERLKRAKANDYLLIAKELGASDLHLMTGLPPMIRVHGTLVELPAEPLTFDGSVSLVLSQLPKHFVAKYYSQKNLDFRMEVPKVGRVRTNLFRHYGGIAGVFHFLPDRVRTFEDLLLPEAVSGLADWRCGLVLVTGPLRSGKSTTISCLVDRINRTQKRHIITVEKPIDVIFESRMSLVSQAEVGVHGETFGAAIRDALREDPDVLVVSDIRDLETMRLCMTAAQTGLLVLGALPTWNVTDTIFRVVHSFPRWEREAVQELLAGSLRGVVSQDLVPRADGKGQALATEVLLVNAQAADMIRDGKIESIAGALSNGAGEGSHSMDDSLAKLVEEGAVSPETARQRAANPYRFGEAE